MTLLGKIIDKIPYRKGLPWYWLLAALLATLGGGAILIAMSAGIGVLFFGTQDPKLNLFLITGQVLAVFPLLAVFLWAPPTGQLLRKLGIRPLTRLDLVVIPGAYGVIFLGSMLLTFVWQAGLDLLGIPYAAEQDLSILARSLTTGQFLYLGFLAATIVPIFEEIFFRRCIYGLLRPLGPKNAFFLGAAIFSLVHFFLLGIPALFLMGAVFQFVYHLRRNLLVPMILHMTVNFLALLSVYCGFE